MTRSRRLAFVALTLASALGAGGPPPKDPAAKRAGVGVNRSLPPVETGTPARPASPAPATPAEPARTPSVSPELVVDRLSTVALFALASLAPAAVLMVTAFVRINIVLVLLRQALGSPQVPGNQVLSALALLLTALVMRPVGEDVYHRAVEPYTSKKIAWDEACRAASRPVKAFMLEQIERTGHWHYLEAIQDELAPPDRPEPVTNDDLSLGVVATSYLLSELTTALVIGFYLYLPFLVVDLVVSAVLAAMGLFMLPPTLVALPLKLILFVAAEGWLHVATLLLRSFGPIGSSP